MDDVATRNALIIELRRNGATLQQISDRVRLTPAQVCRIIQTKGRDDQAYVRTGRGQGMPCPLCGGHSRTTHTFDPGAAGRIRRHECLSCAHIWKSLQVNL
jgi:hypothetical protein